MKPDPLDSLIADYSRQPLPASHERLTADVWHEIGERLQQSFWTRNLSLLGWRELFSEPRLAVPALCLALGIGVLPTLLLAKPQTEQRLVRASLHFEMFSSQSPGLPAALLARHDPTTNRTQR